jgi:hypothetical protein
MAVRSHGERGITYRERVTVSWSHGVSLAVVTRILAGRRGISGLMPGGGIVFFIFNGALKIGSGAHSASCSLGTGGSWPGSEAVCAWVRPVPQVLRRIRGGKPPLFYVPSRRVVQLSTGKTIYYYYYYYYYKHVHSGHAFGCFICYTADSFAVDTLSMF